jgi:hypothetical protein
LISYESELGRLSQSLRPVYFNFVTIFNLVSLWVADSMIKFKDSHYPKGVILYAIFFYVRYGVSYRDLEEIMAERDVEGACRKDYQRPQLHLNGLAFILY